MKVVIKTNNNNKVLTQVKIVINDKIIKLISLLNIKGITYRKHGRRVSAQNKKVISLM